MSLAVGGTYIHARRALPKTSLILILIFSYFFCKHNMPFFAHQLLVVLCMLASLLVMVLRPSLKALHLNF